MNIWIYMKEMICVNPNCRSPILFS